MCVKSKAITLYADGVGVTFLRKIREVVHKQTGGRVEDR